MIAHLAGRTLGWYARRRRRQLERIWRDPVAVQEATLLRLTPAARDTEFGLAHGFDGVRSVSEYQARVPVRDYRAFARTFDRVQAGEDDVMWPGPPARPARTAGTGRPAKLVPLTPAACRSHAKGCRDSLLMAVERVGARVLLDGPALLIAGDRPAAGGVGGLLDILRESLPPGTRGRGCVPPIGPATADWEVQLDRLAAHAAARDLRLIAGVPAWLTMFFERVARQRPHRARRDLADCWPDLRVIVHGGQGLAPYAGLLEEWLGRQMERIEVYPSCEAFVAVQTEPRGGLTLMLDYDVFYEFVPLDDIDSDTPRRHTVADVELHRPYGVVMTTPGLWSYRLGDAVRFTHRDPLRLAVIGGIDQHVDVAGESVTVEELEGALLAACRRTHADVFEFTVAPCDAATGSPAGHEWLIEFRTPPQEPQEFTRILDESLARVNAAYRARRADRLSLDPPLVTVLGPGTFLAWLRAAGPLGPGRKVPRARNDRTVADAIGSADARSFTQTSRAGNVYATGRA